LQPPGQEALSADQQSNPEQNRNGSFERSTPSMQDGRGFDQPAWQGLRTQNAIDHDFEGQGVKQR